MKQIIEGRVYNTETATLIASDKYWDGHNFERNGRNVFLFKTPRGNYFLHYTTLWEGERDSIVPISEAEAREWYEKLPEHNLEYSVVFGEEPEEA